MITIKKLQTTDCDTVVQLWDDGTVEETGYHLSDETRKRVTANLLQYVDHNEVFAFVARDGDTIIGYITGWISAHPVMAGLSGEIEELYVKSAYRRQGIGTRLIEEALNHLREMAPDSVYRVHVGSDNADVKAFWQQHGWEDDLTVFSLYSA